MALHPLAGKPPPRSLLADLPQLVTAYFALEPDVAVAAEQVAFGTSGHRGSSLRRSFNEGHVLAVTQAVCRYRHGRGIAGPLFLGRDTHALSAPARATVLEVLAANDVEVRIDEADGYTPTPAVSQAILDWNRDRAADDRGRADGIVITPSHNPPDDGGIKYNPPHGGPAETAVTGWIERTANELLANRNREVQRMSLARALAAPTTRPHDFVGQYAAALADALDLEAVRAAGVRIGVDPLGGAAVGYWGRIAERYRIDLTVVNDVVDPCFSFVRVDHDGRIRMDCSSPWAMAGLVELADRFDVAFANDPDADRHGIVVPRAGLMNPNHYLAVAIDHLFRHRPGWPAGAAVGKTLVSSSLIDRVAGDLGRALLEVPVGFKWFVGALLEGRCGFAGEESAGASFLRADGRAFTTDKDGLLLGLLAAEIRAVTGRDPGELYRALAARLGEPVYARIDVPADAAARAVLKKLAPAQVGATELAGEPITDRITVAPGNGEPIGGLKITTRNGWFAARPSGTEDVYKVYAESFLGPDHLARIQEEARAIVASALRSAGAD